MQAAEPIEAAVLFESSASRRWIRIELPALAPAIGAVAAVCFALSLNDTGVLVLTVPPGSEVLPLRVDNLLHYGEPAQAVALAVFTAVVAALPAAVGVAWSEGARA